MSWCHEGEEQMVQCKSRSTLWPSTEPHAHQHPPLAQLHFLPSPCPLCPSPLTPPVAPFLSGPCT